MTNRDRASARAAAGGWRASCLGAALLAAIVAGGLAGSGSPPGVGSARASGAAETAQSGRATTPDGTGGVNAPETLDKPYLVLVSFDGFRHDYLDLYATPTFDRVAARGVIADALVPPYPSLTFPAHYTIATGLHPSATAWWATASSTPPAAPSTATATAGQRGGRHLVRRRAHLGDGRDPGHGGGGDADGGHRGGRRRGAFDLLDPLRRPRHPPRAGRPGSRLAGPAAGAAAPPRHAVLLVGRRRRPQLGAGVARRRRGGGAGRRRPRAIARRHRRAAPRRRGVGSAGLGPRHGRDGPRRGDRPRGRSRTCAASTPSSAGPARICSSRVAMPAHGRCATTSTTGPGAGAITGGRARLPAERGACGAALPRRSPDRRRGGGSRPRA